VKIDEQGRKSTCMMFILAFTLASSSYGQITFERTYGGRLSEVGTCVEQTSDGGYIIAGYAESFGHGHTDVYLIKTDSCGDTLWTRTYGGSEWDVASCVRQTSDGGYIIVGETSSFGAGFMDAYVIRTDSHGDTLWTKTFGGSQTEVAESVRQTSDGGYVIVGSTSSGHSSNDVYLIRMDSAGDTLWTRTYGGFTIDWGHSVEETLDHGYIIAGYTRSFGAGSDDAYLIRTNSVGDVVWQATYGGSTYDWAFSVDQTADGGYVLAGYTYSFGAGWDDLYLVKTDSLGNTLWTKVYGGGLWDEGKCVWQLSDGGYIVAGFTYSFGAGECDVWLLRTDPSGDTLWTRTYGGIMLDPGYSVWETRDSGYILVGATESFGAGGHDVYLIKTDENGLTGVAAPSSPPKPRASGLTLLQNSPNPFRRSTLISYSLPQATHLTLSIYDITGRLVETLVNEPQQPGIHRVRWNRKANPSGVYFYRMQAGEFVETRKMVVVR
jgi:hypothetical protein